jgi:hypothetical protein
MVAGPELADAASQALGTKMHFKSITECVESSATSQSYDDEIFDRGSWAAVPLIHTKSDRRRRRSSIRPRALKWTRVSGNVLIRSSTSLSSFEHLEPVWCLLTPSVAEKSIFSNTTPSSARARQRTAPSSHICKSSGTSRRRCQISSRLTQ